ncbi:MAG: hypothetical protein BWK78_04840 [Thiotrichaceae bacterium IS1]|nr:MAG: hypothetical protein BWK78_04840 [Thiotrichaceae bacterium IS1]
MFPFDPSKSVAILFGAGEWPDYPELNPKLDISAPLNPFQCSFEGMRECFLRILKVKQENILELFNRGDSPLETVKKMRNFLKERTSKETIEDVFFYYVGHGGFDREQKYCLLIRSTDQSIISASAFHVSYLAEVLRDFNYLRRYIILDACFSGKARLYLSGGAIEQAMKEQIFQHISKSGSLLFCSSSGDKASTIVEEEHITLFTGTVLKVIGAGSKKLPSFLSFYEIADLTRESIKQHYPDQLIFPELHITEQEEGNIGHTRIFPNNFKITRTLDFIVIDKGGNKSYFTNYSRKVVTESQFYRMPIDTIDECFVVYREWSREDKSYNDYYESLMKMTGFVEKGGVVVLNVAGNCGNQDNIAPLQVHYRCSYNNREKFIDSTHPYITGTKYGEQPISESGFDGWNYTDHGFLINIPKFASVLLSNSDGASLIEYRLGKGLVIVSTITFGCCTQKSSDPGQPLTNLVKYVKYMANG